MFRLWNKKSKWCKKGDKLQKTDDELGSMLSAMSLSFIGQEIGVLSSVADLRVDAVGCSKRGRKITIGHHIFKNNKWIQE